MEVITLSLILSLVTIILWLYNCRRKQAFFKRHGIPGPEPALLVGNIYQLKATGNPNDVLECWIDQYGNHFGYFKGIVPHLVVNDVEVVKQIMIKEFQLFHNRVPFVIDVKPLAYSLINSKGDHWKNVRRVLTPAFSAAKMRLMVDTMNSHVERMVQVIEGLTSEARGGGEFDVSGVVQALTLDVIGSCALAMDIRSQGNPQDELFQAVRQFFRYAQNPAVDMAMFFPPLRPLFAFLNNHLTAGKMTDAIVANLKYVIGLRRRDLTQRRTDVLQLMLDAAEAENTSLSGRQVSDKDIVANSYVFMLAGYETTATALSFTLYLLAKHPDVQERLYAEIIDTLGREGKERPTYEDVQAMQYLDQVFQESLRLYPPVTNFITRVCEEDTTIDGKFIPKGAVVEVPVWHIHHDPDLWPDPWRFDPERFSPTEGKTKTPTLWAFGVGPRNCIGMRFAQLEAKLALVHIVRKFVLENSPRNPEPLTLVCTTVIIGTKEGPFVKAIPRCQ